MRAFLSMLGAALLASVAVAADPYNIQLTSMSQKPVLSVANPSGQGHSPCNFTFNPAWVPNSSPPGIFVRAAECPPEWGGSDDKILFAPCTLDGNCADPYPSDKFTFPEGSEDPRVVYDDSTSTWINYWYSPLPSGGDPKCTSPQCTVALGFSQQPLNASSWFEEPPIRLPWHRNGCLLLRDEPPHYAIFGEGPDPLPGIGIATTTDLRNYTTVNSTWLLPLGTAQNEIKLEAGTPPVRLSTGDYLFFYAAATPGWVANGNYTAGAIIMDKDDPTKILQRVPHFLVPLLPYQQGIPPYPVNRARVIFLPSVTPIPGQPDSFRLFFGAADASVGTAVVTVTAQ